MMGKKVPTASEMRIRAKESCISRPIRVELLPLYNSCLQALDDSRGWHPYFRYIEDIRTDQYADVRIENNTPSAEVEQVCSALNKLGYYAYWAKGVKSAYTHHDTLRICWDSKVLAKRGRVALAALSGMPISPCKGCGDACCGSCRRKDVYDDLMRDYC